MASKRILDPRTQVEALFAGRRKPSWVALCTFCLAASGHATAAAIIAEHPAPADAVDEPIDVDFLLPPEPPPPEATPPLPEPEPAPKLQSEPPMAKPEAARAAAPLAAPPVMTRPSEPSPSARDEVVDFASDPRGSVYSGGVVAVGGRGTVASFRPTSSTGLAGRAAPAAVPPRQAVVAPALPKLSRKPRLAEADPCRGFFPSGAGVDSGTTTVRVSLSPNGSVQRAIGVAESPAGHGFAAAARSCMLTKRFDPARDESGNPVAYTINVNVRFRR